MARCHFSIPIGGLSQLQKTEDDSNHPRPKAQSDYERKIPQSAIRLIPIGGSSSG
jgi:hypothetical protein